MWLLDWQGSPAGRDQWMCRSLHHAAGMWLFKGDITVPCLQLKCVPECILIWYLILYVLQEQGQAGETAGPSRDVLPEAGAVPNALRLGNRQHHGGHLDGDARPRRHRLRQLKRECVYLPWQLPACGVQDCAWLFSLAFPGKSSSIDRRAQLPRRNSERYNTMDDQFCNISAFKPATITISTIFKQVCQPCFVTKRVG